MSWRVRVCLLLVSCTLQVLSLDHQDRVIMKVDGLNGESQIIGTISKLRVDRQLAEQPSSNKSAMVTAVNDADRSIRNAENGKTSSNFKITADEASFSNTPESYSTYLHGNKRENRKTRTQIQSKAKNILYFFAADDGANTNIKDRDAKYEDPLPSNRKNNKKTNSYSPPNHRRFKRQKLTTQDWDSSYVHHSPSSTMKISTLKHISEKPKKFSFNKSVMQRRTDKLNLNKLLTGEKQNLQSDQLHPAKGSFLPKYRFNELTHGINAMPHIQNNPNRLTIQLQEDNKNIKQSRSDKLLLGEEAIAREHAKLVHDINSLLEYKGWSGPKTAETTTELRDEEDSIYIEDLETRTQPSVLSTAAPRTPSVNLKILPKTVPGKTAVALPLVVIGGDSTNHLTKPLPTTHPYPFVGAASTSFPMRLRPVMYAYPIRSKPTLWQRFVALFPKLVR